MKSIIELHFKCEKHTRRKIKLVNKEKIEQEIVKALSAYDKEAHNVVKHCLQINVYFISKWLACS